MSYKTIKKTITPYKRLHCKKKQCNLLLYSGLFPIRFQYHLPSSQLGYLIFFIKFAFYRNLYLPEKMKKLILLLLIASSTLPLCFGAAKEDELIKSIQGTLAQTSSKKDSIRLLYDIWDLSSRNNQLQLGKQLFGVATRDNNAAVQHDILRMMANITSNDTILAELEDMNKNLKSSKAQKETELFIRIKRAAVQARYVPESQRQKKITEIIALSDYDKLDKYGKVERLFTICEYLSNFAQGELLVEYLSDLGDLMKECDFDSYSLRNIYFSESANIFTATNNRKKALEADRELLKIINQLEKEYRSKGRRYRNYDISRYIIYRRMLSNYSVLSEKEVNDIYAKILALVEKNDDVKSDFFRKRRTSAYHAMKNKRYSEAIPYIESQLEIEKSLSIRKQLYEMLMTATKESGDSIGYSAARNAYAKITQEYDSLHAEAKYNELNVRYEVNMLKSENARLELERRDTEITNARRTMTFVIVGWVVFGVFLILMLLLWTRYRRTINNLSNFVNSLVKERDTLKRKRYGERSNRGTATTRQFPVRKYEKSVSGMLNYILNDVLYIASIGQEDSNRFRTEVDANGFTREISENIMAHLTKNVSLDVKYAEKNFNLFVDKECLQWLTEHILKVAVRLAPSGGNVSFECRKSDSGDAQFIFTHSGESLPDGKEDLIFDNFITYENLVNEKFAALKMCRMIHFLIDSSLLSDRNINTGKLTLTIPLTPRD